MTKITYLKAAKTLQELKTLYFKIAKTLHPDHGGSTELMQQLNNEYDYLKTILHNKEPKESNNSEQKTYHENSYTMAAFKDIIADLLRYNNITIEIIGSWLWISGKGTYTIKDELKEKYSCKWSKSQKKWYWFSGIEKQEWKPKGGYLQQAINKYGIEKLESQTLQAIA